MVYRRKHHREWYVAVPVLKGLAVVWVKRSTGTMHKPTASAIEAMLSAIGPRGKPAWDLLTGVAELKLSLAVLYEYYQRGAIDDLRARLADQDLAPLIPAWKSWVETHRTARTAEYYEAQVRRLIPEGTRYLRSQATRPALASWLDALKVSGSTKRRYKAALQSFFAYCVRQGLLDRRPLDGVESPPENAPRMRYLLEPDVVQFTEAFPLPYATAVALTFGAGLETAVALDLRVRHVAADRREIFAPGTKTWCRERWVRVAEWAWPFIERALKGKLPDALLCEGLMAPKFTYRMRAIAATKTEWEGLQPRDGRHAWAVRAARAGTPVEIIARQLGHRDGTMVLRIYGRFLPSQHDREKWEQVAASRGAQASGSGGK